MTTLGALRELSVDPRAWTWVEFTAGLMYGGSDAVSHRGKDRAPGHAPTVATQATPPPAGDQTTSPASTATGPRPVPPPGQTQRRRR